MGARRTGSQDDRGRDRIRRRLLLAFERAEVTEDPAERRRLLTFVVIGAGPTGVELAVRWSTGTPRHATGVPPHRPRQGGSFWSRRAAGAADLPEELGTVARRSLEGMTVQVLTDTRVTAAPDRRRMRREADGRRHHRLGRGRRRLAGRCLGSARSATGPAASGGANLAVPGRRLYAVATWPLSPMRRASDPGHAPAAKQLPPCRPRACARAAGSRRRALRLPHHATRHPAAARRGALDGMRLTGLIAGVSGHRHVWYLISFRSRVASLRVALELSHLPARRPADHRA